MTGAGAVGIGVIGAGVISSQYLDTLTSSPDVVVLFIADLDLGRAESQATSYGVPGWGTVDELLAHPGIEIVVNLTIPAEHAAVTRKALRAGKNVWTEKPLALDRTSGRELLEEALRLDLRVASAPDTFLGAGLQTALRTIAQGTIGAPLTALALMQSPGPESWHPNPEFLFQAGGGPLFDIGPYYLTALVQALGPATAVTAVESTSRSTRVIGSGPRAGTEFAVTVPTHHGAIIRFENGSSAQIVFSFQSHRKRSGFLEVSGEKGTLVFPDPNSFGGDSVLFDGADEGRVIPAIGSPASRGIGVVELARSIRAGHQERASGTQAFHVLDIMIAIAESARSGEPRAVVSSFERAADLPEEWDPRSATL